jgi:8-oxo-dGTP diphosphatase
MNPIRVCCAIIYFQDNKILVVQRGNSMRHEGKWEFPGGKIETGESEEECIKREIREELRIEINIIGTLRSNFHRYQDFEIQLIPFTAMYVSGQIELKEHAQYKLLKKEELLSLDWAEADIPIVKELCGKAEE